MLQGKAIFHLYIIITFSHVLTWIGLVLIHFTVLIHMVPTTGAVAKHLYMTNVTHRSYSRFSNMLNECLVFKTDIFQ